MAKSSKKQTGLQLSGEGEFVSGEIVTPGIYVDVQTGATITMREEDELPEGVRVLRFARRFRRLEGTATGQETRAGRRAA